MSNSVPLWAVAVGMLALGGVFAAVNLSGTSGDSARGEARKWSAQMGIKIKRMNCQRMDTDGDGYVSCQIRDSSGRIHYVECAGALTLQSGCRMPKATLGRQ